MSDTVNSVTRFLKRCFVAGSERAPGIRPAPLLMPLEPRIVYDASIAALAVAAHHQLSAAGRPAEHVGAPERVGQSLAGRTSPPPAEHGSPVTHRGGETRSITREPAGIRQGPLPLRDTSNAQQQVVFIDPSVSGYQELITGLPAGTHYVLLNPNTDGLQQIAQYLQQHPGVDAIHLISHGAEGQIQVGATWLNEGDLSAHSSELAEIGAAMRPGGDFLIYGCDVAEHTDGQGLVRQIAALTHLNVAASTDPTGAAALGGNWTLEYDVGAVHTPVILSKTAEQQYSGLLGVTVETYDGQIGYDTAGGATGVTSFSLDGITYTLDQASEFAVDSTTVNQFGPPPLTSGPTDGVLFGNVQGTSLTSMTMSLQNGDKMAVQSFDIDINAPSVVAVEALDASGTVIGSVTLNTATNGGSSVFHVNVSSNSSFSDVKSLKFVETDGAFLTPTLNNFAYVDLSSPPVVTSTGGSAAFIEANNTTSTPVVIDSGITLTDGDATTAKQGTVSITGNFASGQDVLAFTNTSAATYGDIAGSYNASTGVLTLTSASGAATISQWQAAFRSVTYTDTAVTPSTATRTVGFELTSDAYHSSSNTATKSVTVTATDQSSIVTTTGGTTSYVGGTSARTIDGGISVSDSDNTTQSSGTVSITSGFHSGDTLAFTNTSSASFGNISASYNSATGVLVLTSAGATATDAQWAHVLSSVTFSSTSTTYGNRTVSFSTSDGTNTSAAATDTVNVSSPAPVMTTDSGSASFVAGDNSASTPVAVDAGLTVTDPAGSTLASATAAISGNFHSGEDVLAFSNDGATMGNIASSYNAATGVLTMTSAGATATLAQWQAALESVTYTDTAVTPNNATRTVSFSAVDVNSNTSSTATRTVTVTDTDQTPIVTTTGGTTTYVGGTSATTIDGGISVSDSDNTTQSSGTVSIGSGFHSGDTLAFTNTSSALFGNIAASYNAGTGVLTLTSSGATATDAQWANALSSVTFSSTSTTYGNRTIAFATSDGTKSSAAATDTVAVLAPPKITTDSGSASFVAGDNTASSPVTIDSGLTVTDGSSTTLASGTVAITGGFRSGEDMLAFTNDGATMGNIAGSYNAATGVLTMTSSGAAATLAQWQAALDAVTYTDTAVTPNNATRTVSFTAVDGGGTTSNTATRTVTVTDTDQTPIVATTGGTTGYVDGTSATRIDGGISVSDLDNTTQSSGTVSISSGFHSGDTLAFTNTSSAQFGNIVGSYNAATGVLTLTSSGATATDAQWANALSSVTFSSTSTTYGNRTIAIATSDGTKTSVAATDTVSVLGPPQITADSGSASFVAGDNTASTPVTIDSGLSVTDGASTTLASATVAITGSFHGGEDVLAFANTSSTAFGNIAGSYNAATGVLTLTSSGATASLAQWQAALDAVTYTDIAVTPNNATRTVSFTVVDGGGTTSNTATRTVTVADTDQTPIVTSDSGSASFVAGDNTPSTPVAVDSGIGITKGDSTPLSGATVAITGSFQGGEDVLAFTNASSTTFGNIAGSYNATTGVLTLTSSGNSATLAQWQAALRAVTYTDTAVTPNSATRTVSFSLGDGITTSATATRTVTVTDADQTPIVTADSGNASFVAGDNTPSTPVTVDGGMAIIKGDSTPLSSAAVAITGNFQSGEDVLAFTNTSGATFGNISGSYDSGTGVLTLTSSGNSATLAQWQAALRAVTYTDTAVTPNSATRTVSFSVSDGITTSTAATRTVTVADTDQTPIVTPDSGSASFVAGDNTPSTPVAVDSGIGITKGDSTPLSGATVAITGSFQGGEDVLAFTNASSTTFGNIAGSYNATTGVLTLTSSGNSATLAQWQAALRAVTYTDTAVTPNSATRTVSFSLGDGITTSATATRTVTVTDADQTPIVTADSGNASFVAGDNTPSTPVTVDGGMAIIKGDSTPLSSATVAITTDFQSGEDVLAFTNTSGATFGNISGSYDSGTGVLTLTSSGNSATLAQWHAALRAVTYTDTAVTPNSATRTVSFSVSDGITTSTAATRTVTVADTDQTPVVTSDSGSASFVAGDNAPAIPVTVDSGITVTKGDSAPLSSATVVITGNFHSGEDVLAFANTSSTTFGNISGSYDASTGVLTLTSSGDAATLTQWQAALRAVTYTDTAVTPNNAMRTISFTVVDGAGTTGNTAMRTVMVTDTDQTPVVTTTAGMTNYVAATAATTIDSGVTVSDLDNVAQASGTVSISSGFQASDVLGFANNSLVKYGNIVGSYDASTGVLTLTSAGATATDAQWQNALDAVTFSAGSNVAPGPLTVSFVINDGSESSAASTRSVELLAPPSPPLLFGRPAVAPQASGAPTGLATDTGSTPLFVMTELDPQSVSGFMPSIETAIYSGAALDGGLLGISSDGSRTESGIDVPSWLLPIRSWSALTTKGLPDGFTHDGAHGPEHQEAAMKAGNRFESGPSLPGPKPAPPVSKPSLAEQFARHRRALHVSRHQPLLRSDRSA